MADEDGEFPIGSHNDWEVKVLEREMGHSELLAWYRNPGRASADSLAIADKDGKGASTAAKTSCSSPVTTAG